jgi:hypothetical protein
MSTEHKQSDIAEVRDQLSLDFADAEYLNVIGQNLGLDRPILGFDDDRWRALVKTLALEYKQISNKFRDVLEIVFGPRITEVATLSSDVALGDAFCFLNETSNLPQVGTLVFDEGLPIEETKAYCLIDRITNKVFLVGSFGVGHIAREFDSEEPLIAVSDADELVFLKTNNFPDADYTYPIVLGRGTANEEVVQVSNNDTATGILTLSTTPVFSHALVRTSDVSDQLNQPYFTSAALLLLEDSSLFPPEGILKLYPTDTFEVTASSSGLTDRTITCAALSFEANSLVGYEIVFDSAATQADLQGHTKRIVSNTTNVITVAVDWTDDTVFPILGAPGDTFVINPIVQYSSLDYDTHTITLREPILQDFDIPLNSKVELMVSEETAALSPVKFAGTGWDIIQSTPRLVELLLPEDIRDPNDLRSSSHVHDDRLGAITTTNSVQVDPDDTTVTAISFAAFPAAGTLEFDPGGGTAERVAYGTPISYITVFAAAGSGTFILQDSSLFPASGDVLIDSGTVEEETVVYVSNDTATGEITLAGTLANDHRVGHVVACTTQLNLQSVAINTHIIGTTVDFYQPLYVTVPIGDFNQVVDTFPGPYVYDIGERSATATVASTNTTTLIPGPSLLQISQVQGNEVFEVGDALPMVEAFGGSIFDLTVGLGTAAEELIQVNSVTLKNRAITTLVANSLIGDTVIALTTHAPGLTIEGASFPDARGYRVVIDEAVAADREVTYVLGTTTVAATAAIGSGADGTVNITAVGALAGEPGNTATVEVFEPAGTHPLTVFAVGGTLTVELRVIAGFAQVADNTATLIAAAISLLDDFSATASGTGADSILDPEGPFSFTGGSSALLLESPLTKAHTLGDSVAPMSDLVVAETITKSHQGEVSNSFRSTALVDPAPWIDATAAIGSGVDGTVNITAVGALAGFAGNSATVEVIDPTPTNGALTVVESPAGIIAVTLAVAAGVLDTAANTALLIAAAIDALDDFSALHSGTGATSLTLDEGPTSFTGGIDAADAYYLIEDTLSAEIAAPRVDSITVVSATGMDIDGGFVWLNFGNGKLPVESTLAAPMIATDTTAALVSSDDFPSPTSFFTATIGVGLRTEEKVLVTANNTGTDVFTLAGGTYGVQYAHATGELVRFEPGGDEVVQYSEIDTNVLRFSPDIVLQYTHYPVESVIDSSATSDPRTNGYDFPLRMPVDILVRLEYLLDIVRAAGVQVELIVQR